jgi:hypothetical protein
MLLATQVASRRLSGDGGVVTVDPEAHAAELVEVSAVVVTVSVVAADAGTAVIASHRQMPRKEAVRQATADCRPALRMLSMTVLGGDANDSPSAP